MSESKNRRLETNYPTNYHATMVDYDRVIQMDDLADFKDLLRHTIDLDDAEFAKSLFQKLLNSSLSKERVTCFLLEYVELLF